MAYCFGRLYWYLEKGDGSMALWGGRFEAGVAEVPGPNANPIIAEALAGCVRGGRFILGAHPSDEIAWCAAAAPSGLARNG